MLIEQTTPFHISDYLAEDEVTAEKTRLSRASLCQALPNGSKPQLDTMLKALSAVGGHLNIQTT